MWKEFQFFWRKCKIVSLFSPKFENGSIFTAKFEKCFNFSFECEMCFTFFSTNANNVSLFLYKMLKVFHPFFDKMPNFFLFFFWLFFDKMLKSVSFFFLQKRKFFLFFWKDTKNHQVFISCLHFSMVFSLIYVQKLIKFLNMCANSEH